MTLPADSRAGSAMIQVRAIGLEPGQLFLADNITLRNDAVKRVLATGFDTAPIGPMRVRTYRSTIGGPVGAKNLDDTSIRVDKRGGRVIRTTLRAKTIHSIPAGNNGINTFRPLRRLGATSKRIDDACLAYRIRFDKHFDWSLGGKLPGLEGVAPGVAPSYPTGGTRPGSKGWSGRQMWVGPEAYSWAAPTNMGLNYMYGPDQASAYGDNILWHRAFDRGRWHSVQVCYTLNTVGQADGVLQTWYDGQIVVRDTTWVYRTAGNVHINYLAWSVFRGGHTAAWAGKRTGYVEFDDLRVTAR
ncbi:MAG: hypothetical protein QM655_09390 [Nocardioidaceae bacterium]